MEDQDNKEVDVNVFDFNMNQINVIKIPSHFNNKFAALSSDSKNNLILYPINDGKIIKEQFFCTECKKILSNSGGNAAKHIKIHNDKSIIISLIKNISSSLIDFIYSTAQPLSIILSDPFRKIIDLFDTGFIPSENWLNNSIREDEKNFEEIILQKLNTESMITIGFDEWTHQQKRYLAIVGYCSTYNILLSFKEPNNMKRTSEVLSKEIDDVLHKYNIRNKIFCVTSDAASVCRKTANIMNFNWYPCICHVLQRISLNTLKHIEGLNEILQKANHYHDDCQYLSFPFSSKNIKISKYTNTIWLSIRKTIYSIIQAKQQIHEYQCFITEYENKKISDALFGVKKSSFFTNNDFKFCYYILPILDEFDKSLRSFQEDSTNSIFYELQNLIQAYNDIQHVILQSPFYSIEPHFSQEFKKRLEKGKDFMMPLLVAAAILNPTIDIDLLLGHEFQNYKESGMDMITRLAKIEPSFEVMDSNPLDGKIGKRKIKVSFNEIESFLNHIEYYALAEEENIITFWEHHKNKYPKLYDLYKIFSQLPTSTGFIERIFSQIKFMVGDKRYNLDPNKLEFLAKAFVHPDLAHIAIMNSESKLHHYFSKR